MIDSAGRRQHQFAGRIMGRQIVGQRRTRHARDRLRRTQHRPADRLIGKGRRLEMIEDDVVGRVVGLADFLQHDRPFAHQFGLVEGRVLQKIADNIDRQRDVLFQDARVIGGIFAGRIGIHLAADRLDLLGDRLCRPPRRSFEQHMFQQVGDAVLRLGLVAGPATCPDADGRGLDSRHVIGCDAQPVRQRGDANMGGQFDGARRRKRRLGFVEGAVFRQIHPPTIERRVLICTYCAVD